MDKSFVTLFLFDIKRSEVNGSILQFQSTVFEKDDIKKLIHTLNNLKDCDDNTAEKTVKEEIYSPEIIEAILELSRDNQKLLRNPDTKVIESIDGLKERIDITLFKFERSVDVEERRMTRKYRTILMDELVHSILSESQKQYAFLIVLSMIQDKFPWVYNMRKELLDMLASKNNIDVKREAIRNFQKIMEFSFEHPAMRELYMRRKDEYIMMRDIEHMLMELINALEYDITSSVIAMATI